MILQVKVGSSYYDLVPYLPSDPLGGNETDLQGPNVGVDLLGRPIDDIINRKRTLSVSTRYLSETTCSIISNWLRLKELVVKTDYFGALQVFTVARCYEITKNKINDTYAQLIFTLELYDE